MQDLRISKLEKILVSNGSSLLLAIGYLEINVDLLSSRDACTLQLNTSHHLGDQTAKYFAAPEVTLESLFAKKEKPFACGILSHLRVARVPVEAECEAQRYGEHGVPRRGR